MPTSFSRASSVFLSQSDVTGSRVVGTVYQNTTGKPMFVLISSYTSLAGQAVSLYTDAANPPTTEVALHATANANYTTVISGIVLPGNYYKVEWSGAGTETVYKWVEWY